MALLIDKNKPKTYSDYEKHDYGESPPVSKTKASGRKRKKIDVTGNNPGRPRKDGEPTKKLKEEDVLRMRQMDKDGLPLRIICKEFPGISYNHIHQVIKRMYWKNI
jgi:hypothetical protein